MYSAFNKGKYVVAKRFMRTLKSKIYKHMTSVSKNVCIDKLEDIVNEYNNTYERKIKMRPIEVINNTNFDSIKEGNDKNPKFKVGDHARISKHKNILAKGYTPNWSEEVFGIKEVRNTVPWKYFINDINGKEIIGNQQGFRIEKVIKKKGNKLYVKLKGYDNWFNRWINKKMIKFCTKTKFS